MTGFVFSCAVHGTDAYIVRVETDISNGMPGFELVGYLGSEVKESRERVVTAVNNAGFTVPAKKIIVNLSPANIRKHGTGFDLPIAISMLISAGEIDANSVEGCLICGELMLSGEICAIRGVLPIVIEARRNGMKKCIIPKENAKEGAVIDDIEIIAVASLKELICYLRGEQYIEPEESFDISAYRDTKRSEYDFSDVQGQRCAKRGLEIAAAGLHNVLMIGPPGTGKTLLAKCLPGILPPLSRDESLEVSSIYSIAGMLNENRRLIVERPVVSAHHTVTDVALTGGGNVPKPGLIALAHRGVLFLDEMPEFNRKSLEALRQPIEDRVIHIVRNNYICDYSADFMLVGALNPCPCGMYPDTTKCTCTENMRRNYIGKLSRPLIDRMDICMTVARPSTDEIINKRKEETSDSVRKRVIRAQKIQEERFRGTGIFFNSRMGTNEIDKYCHLGDAERKLMENALNKYELSARAYYRILKCARTIADLDESEDIKISHITEALFYKADI